MNRDTFINTIMYSLIVFVVFFQFSQLIHILPPLVVCVVDTEWRILKLVVLIIKQGPKFKERSPSLDFQFLVLCHVHALFN